MKCHRCGKSMLKGQKFWVCEYCDIKLPIDLNSCANSNENLFLGHLPSIIAVPIVEYYTENDSYIKIHRLTHMFEMITRFCTAITLSEILRQCGEFSENLKKELTYKIERPSFGAWKDMLKLCSQQQEVKKGPVKELPDFLKFLLENLKDVIRTRNRVVHAGRLSYEDCEKCLVKLTPIFNELLNRLQFFESYDIVGIDEKGGAINLKEIKGKEFVNLSQELLWISGGDQVDRVFFIRQSDKTVLDLFPLSAFGKVVEPDEEEANASNKFSPMLYFRHERFKYIEYTTIHNRYPHVQESGNAFKRFQKIFRLEEWRRISADKNLLLKYTFKDIIESLTHSFWAHRKHIGNLKKWIKENNKGVLWIHGKPGIGKSALMARMAENLKNGLKQNNMVLRDYYFRGGLQDTCNKQAFLEASILTLLSEMGKSEKIEDEIKKREKQFWRLLKEGLEALRLNKQKKNGKIIFILDGIDEIWQVDKEFPYFIFKEEMIGVLWVCSSRDEKELLEIVDHFRCDWLFKRDTEGLPKLKKEEVREMLVAETGELCYKFFNMDKPDPSGTWKNSFIDTLFHRSEGLPLYLKLLVKDIREKKYDFSDEKALPQSLTLYYEVLFDRIGASDIKRGLTSLLCVLAQSKAALTYNQLKEILRPVLPNVPDWEDLLKKTIAKGHVMIKIMSQESSALAYTLYHESFKQYILASDSLKWSIKEVKSAIFDFCYAWDKFTDNNDSREYALRYLIKHLIEEQKWREIELLARNLEFLEATCREGLIYARLEDYLKILDSLKEKQEWGIRESLKELYSFALNDSHPLHNYPQLTFQQAINQPENSIPYGAALDLMQAGKITQPWFKWINKPSKKNHSILTIKGHTDRVRTCTFSPEGDIAASGSDDNTIRIWDIRTGKELFKGESHHARVLTCSFSKDCQKLVSGSEDGNIKVWDINEKKVVQTMESQNGPANHCKFSSDDKHILFVTGDSNLSLWNPDTNKTLNVFKGHSSKIFACNFFQEGKMIISASVDGVINIWETASMKKMLTSKTRLDHAVYMNPITAGSFSPNGEMIAIGTTKGTLSIIAIESGKEILGFEGSQEDEITCCAFSSTERLLTAGSVRGKINVWNLDTNELLFSCHTHSFDIKNCEFSPNGTRILSCSDMKIEVWDLKKEQMMFQEPQEKNITVCAISPDWKYIASGSIDQVVNFWDLKTGKKINSFRGGNPENMNRKEPTSSLKDELYTLRGHSLFVRACSFTPDGKYMIVGCDDGSLLMWDVSTWKALYCIAGAHSGKVWWCSFAPDGSKFLSCSEDGKLKIWEAEKGTLLLTMQGHTSEVWACAFSADGKTVVSGSNDKTLKIWDSVSGQERLTIRGHKTWITACSFSPDGKYIISGSWDGILKAWQTDNGKELKTFNGHSDGIWGTLFTSDGKYVVSASEDNSIRIWEFETGKPVGMFMGLDRIWGIDIARGGRIIAAGDASGNLYILHPQNLYYRVPIITPVRLYRLETGTWDENISAACSWCSERFTVEADDLGKEVCCPSCKNISTLNLFKVDNTRLSFHVVIWGYNPIAQRCKTVKSITVDVEMGFKYLIFRNFKAN